MAARGCIYYPSKIFPPNQGQSHRVVVVSNTTPLSIHGAQFALVAIIRSAMSRAGARVRLVPGHSVPIPAGTVPSALPDDSIVETHQLFSIHQADLGQSLGNLPHNLLDDVVKGARLLLA